MPDTKSTIVTIELTITYPAKDGMTLADYAAEGKKADGLVAEMKKHGEVSGSVTIGKQRFKL